jgi:aminoglycoside phosphotransferase (APT) family kinase protein
MADQANSNPTSIQGVDVDKVSAWLVANISDARAPFSFSLIAGGRSNLTYKVTDAHNVGDVVRRPPRGHVLATAHDMAREHRIIAAVGKTGVPVPKTLGVCTDESVNGAPFYVMAFVEGEG